MTTVVFFFSSGRTWLRLGEKSQSLFNTTTPHHNKIRRMPLVAREVRKWSGQSEAALQSALHDAVWSTFQENTVDVTDDINGLTESVVDLLCETTEETVSKTTVKSLHNQKPWITRTIRDAINTLTTAHNLGLQPENMDNYKAAAYNVRMWNYISRRVIPEACGKV